jgi:protein CpxP
MKRLILPAVLALAFGSAAFAQQPDPDAPAAAHHAGNPDKEVKRLTKQLDLTADQVTKIQPIVADRDQKIAAATSDASLSDADRKERMKAIHKAFNSQLGEILTPDQRQQMKAAHHAHEKQNQAEPATATPPPTA